MNVEVERELEHEVFQVRFNSLPFLAASSGKQRRVSTQLISGQIFFYPTIDTGSLASFLNKLTTDLILKKNPSLIFKEITRQLVLWHPNDSDLPSNGWKVADALFLVSENRSRNFLDLICTRSWV